MKLVKTASGTQVKMSKKEWTSIGKKAGWMKVAGTDNEHCKKCGELETDVDGLCEKCHKCSKCCACDTFKEETASDKKYRLKKTAQDSGTIKSDLKSMESVMDMARYFLKMNIDDLANLISSLENADKYVDLTMRNKYMLELAKEQLEYRKTAGSKIGQEELNEEPYKI